MPESSLVYSTGLPVVRPKGLSHRETRQVDRDAMEWRPMPMPTIRRVRVTPPWHGATRDPSGGRHRLTVRQVHSPVLSRMSSLCDDMLSMLGGAA